MAAVCRESRSQAYGAGARDRHGDEHRCERSEGRDLASCWKKSGCVRQGAVRGDTRNTIHLATRDNTKPETLVRVNSCELVDGFSAFIAVITKRCHASLRQVRFTLLFKPKSISGSDDQNRRVDE